MYLAQDNVAEAEALLSEVDKKAKQEWFKINKSYHDEAGIVVSYGQAKILSKMDLLVKPLRRLIMPL